MQPTAEMTLDYEEIARRAYMRFEARGGEDGQDLDDWLAAEQDLKAEAGMPETAEEALLEPVSES